MVFPISLINCFWGDKSLVVFQFEPKRLPKRQVYAIRKSLSERGYLWVRTKNGGL